MNKFSEKTKAAEIPQEAFTFNIAGSACNFADDGMPQGDPRNIRLTLYDGSVVNHWYWGNMAFELSSMKMEKMPAPILYGHDTELPVAMGTKAVFEKQFTLEGPYLNADEIDDEDIKRYTKRVQQLGKQKFPLEASLRFDPAKTTIELIREGQSVKVNGNALAGPGVVFKNAIVKEGSVCMFGAQNNCVTESFKEFYERKNSMPEEKVKLTALSFEAEYPDLFKEITAKATKEGAAAAEKAGGERFAKMQELFGDDSDFVVEQFGKGASVEDAKTAYIARLKKKPADTGGNAATQEFTDTQGPGDKAGEPKTFMDAVDAHVKKAGCSRADAVKFCVKAYPELHKKLTSGEEKK